MSGSQGVPFYSLFLPVPRFVGIGSWSYLELVKAGADEQERATPILSLFHGIFTD